MKRSEKADILKDVCECIMEDNLEEGKTVLCRDYPFVQMVNSGRTINDSQRIQQFIKDGFIDRYSGERLINPGMLKVLSNFYPDKFPYHAHWKMSECHIAYWELCPTIDHVIPVARGGADEAENWVTTSMLHNSVKSNWTMEELQWRLYPPGNIDDWDGLTKMFIEMVESHRELLDDNYVKRWLALSNN